MTKATVTRLFIGSLIAFGAGAILAIGAILVALAGDVFVIAGSDIVDIRASALAWSLLGLGIVSAIAMIGGLISGLVAWIGALLNTWQLESRTWFAVLLLTGIFNFGFLAMIAYVVAGPDGTTASAPNRAHAASGA